MTSRATTARVTCSGCGTVLSYPAGSSSVRCVLCSAVTRTTENPSTPPPGAGAGAASPLSHLICGGCRTMLEFPSGASRVRCAICHTVNDSTAVRQLMATIRCRYCDTDLNYPAGARSVRCALCQNVTLVGDTTPLRIHSPRQLGPLRAGLSDRDLRCQEKEEEEEPECGKQSSVLFVVQNPSPIGEERYNMAIGVKISPKDKTVAQAQPIECQAVS